MKRFSAQHGFSLIEMLIYLAILTVVFVVIVNTILSFTGSYRTLSAYRIVEHSAISSFERMTRDIRGATNINAAQSTFDTNPGVLSLTSTIGSVSTTTRFYVDNNTLKVDVNGVYIGPLTTSNVAVTNLTFSRLIGSTTEAVKIDMTLQGTSGPATTSNNYHVTVVVKGS
jgi:prepilin-type N-terminal cleavage/methylation domain-containing protein